MRALLKAVLAAALVAFACQTAGQTTGGNVGGGGGVSQLVAGPNITLNPTNGLGAVTVTASSTASTAFSAITSSSNTQCAPCTIGTGGQLSPLGAGIIQATSVPVAGISGLGASCGTFLATPSSANFFACITDETGSGAVVGGTAPTISNPTFTGGGTFGTPASLDLLHATDLPNASVNGLGTFATANAATPPAIGGTTPAAGSFSTMTVTGQAGGGVQCAHFSNTGALTATGAGDCGTSGGGLTSVGLSTTATWLTAGNTPLIANGTITLNPTTGQTANLFVASPNGTTGAVALRSIVAADLPSTTVTPGSYTYMSGTVDAQGRLTAATSGTAPATSANPTATAGPAAINGSGTAYMLANAAPAVQKASAAQFGIVETDGSTISNASGVISCITATTGQLGCVKPDGTTVTIASGVISAVGGAATTITPGTTTVVGATAPCLIDNSTSTTMGCAALGSTLALNSGTLNTIAANRTVTTSPTVLSSDMGGQVNSNVTGGGTLTIPAISSTIFAGGSTLTVVNYSASTEAVSTTPTVNAGGGCVSGTGIPAGASWQLISNGTTLDCSQTVSSGAGGGVSSFTGDGTLISNSASTGAVTATLATQSAHAAFIGPTSGSAAPTFRALAAADIPASLTATTSVNGSSICSSCTLTPTIARNTLALSTSLITAGSCTDNTGTATGATTSSSFTYAFSADVSAVTGYTSTGLLTLFPYVTSNTVHMKQCNFTASSITPGAASINWVAY